VSIISIFVDDYRERTSSSAGFGTSFLHEVAVFLPLNEPLSNDFRLFSLTILFIKVSASLFYQIIQYTISAFGKSIVP
jgi:hypothetical protein